MPETIDQFKITLRGDLIQPSDEVYDACRKVHNGMIDRRPALIAKCADVADVIACVNFARDTKLLVSIRGGGHNAGGLGVCDGGLVIDLSSMHGVRVDSLPAPSARRADASGATWTTPLTPSAWRHPAASFPPPAWEG
jgi:FAD/FMN-containing dehydrogenase